METVRINIKNTKPSGRANVRVERLVVPQKLLADKIENCKNLILKLDRPDRIVTIQMLIKYKMRELKTDNELEAALELCKEGRADSNLNIWIIGTAGIMIDKK